MQRLLEEEAQTRGKRPFKQVLNDAVRAGLGRPAARTPAFKQPVFSLGRAKIDLTKAGALAADLPRHAAPSMRSPDVNVLLYAVNSDSPSSNCLPSTRSGVAQPT